MNQLFVWRQLLQLDAVKSHLQETSVIAIIALVLAFAWYRRRRGQPQVRSSSVQGEKSRTGKENAEREWGEWTPVKFTYPEFPACTSNLSDIKPIPYRPFRWGQYHVTMGVRDMLWADWIELDNDFPTYYAIRNHRLHSQGENVLRLLPDRPGVVQSARHAAVELAHELSDFVTKRYPSTFTATRDSSGIIKTMNIHPMNVHLELPPSLLKDPSKLVLREVGQEEAEEAMRIAALLVQDDLALMIEGTDGRYYFQGGAICVPGFWRMRDKIGLPLDEIHTTGHVPQFQEKLQNSLERFFKRLSVQKPVIRNNYFMQIVKPENMRRNGTVPTDIPPRKEDEDLIDPLELSWSTTTNGNEDNFVHGRPAHPDAEPIVEPGNLQLRTERQTLRRLPLSGAIVFTIRTYLIPLTELGKEPGVPARLASAVRSWPEGIGRYKGRKNYEQVLLEYLDTCAEEQRRVGGELDNHQGRGYPF
ncbi:hypothetical protein E1B28_005170 [Marasmius oreades]|nr:uncharacterized protein E1B28_005170 [Marasmius oreades]KAG7097856.1 hypothetical protein E1B28_005170 [Marasmius oreades]